MPLSTTNAVAQEAMSIGTDKRIEVRAQRLELWSHSQELIAESKELKAKN